jgi:hypothetical protein
MVWKPLGVVIGTDGMFADNPADQAAFLKRLPSGNLAGLQTKSWRFRPF